MGKRYETESEHDRLFGEVPDYTKKTNNIGRSRTQALQELKASQRREKETAINVLFAKYDRNRSNALDRDELKALLVEFNETHGHAGMKVEDQDLNDLMTMCDISKTGAINRGEVLRAVEVWKNYLKVLPTVDKYFAKYDSNNSGRLELGELKALLEELNGDLPVENYDVYWVIDHADRLGDGKIGKIEMKKMLSFWYVYMADQRRKTTSSYCCCVQ